jgi:xyloglucan-specific endo-beta-1,4-glucanase
MKFQQSLFALPLATLALAAPTPTLDKRATTICGQWDSVVTGTYTVYQDLWGESAATSGSQCTTVNSDENGTLNWSTSWTWAGGSSSVKSFANAVVSATVKRISAISSIPTTWHWRQVDLLQLRASSNYMQLLRLQHCRRRRLRHVHVLILDWLQRV